MEDGLGKKLNIGNKILYYDVYYENLQVGEIVRETSMTVAIQPESEHKLNRGRMSELRMSKSKLKHRTIKL